MNKHTRLIGILLIALVCLTAFVACTSAQQEADLSNAVTVSVEAFVLDGVGFVVEPTAVQLTEGATIGAIIAKLIEDKGLVLQSSGEGDSFYVSGVAGVDLSSAKVNTKLAKLLVDNEVVVADSATKGEDGKYVLDASTFTTMGGWMYTVNGVSPTVGMNAYELKAGDVVRMQYTVSWGADMVGYEYGGWGLPALTTNNAKLENFCALAARISANDYYGNKVAAFTQTLKSVSTWDISASYLEDNITSLTDMYISK